jgi:hypothetical protein
VLAKHGVGPLEAWSGKDAIPAPNGGCEDEAVPAFSPVFLNPQNPDQPINVISLQTRVRDLKTPAFFWNRMNWWQSDFTDPVYLRSVSLGELGSKLEGTVHNQMHIRWSAYPTNGQRQIRDEPDFRELWDDPGYDTLFDEYSSHIGPIFFRLHKWIDNRIEDWAEANASRVRRVTTPYGFDWFAPGDVVHVEEPWTGRWGFEEVDAEEARRRIAIMMQVVGILYPQPAVAAQPLVRRRAPAPAHEILTLRDLI